MRNLSWLATGLLLLLIAAPAHPHGGGLDSKGCHTNRTTGDYHCHRPPATPQCTVSQRELITSIQLLLDSLGHAPSSSRGQLDDRTTAAIRAFQQSQDLPTDGKPSGALLLQLAEAIHRTNR